MKNKEVGKKVAELRVSRGWSQADLANKVGVAKSTVCLWESDSRSPNVKALHRLSEVFGVSTDYFVNESQLDAEKIDYMVYVKEMKNRPEMVLLLEYARRATKDDVLTVASILEKITR